MKTLKRTTVYLDYKLHRAVKLKAAQVHKSVSDLVREALLVSFQEDVADRAALRKRRHEPSRSLKTVIRGLKRDGLL